MLGFRNEARPHLRTKSHRPDCSLLGGGFQRLVMAAAVSLCMQMCFEIMNGQRWPDLGIHIMKKHIYYLVRGGRSLKSLRMLIHISCGPLLLGRLVPPSRRVSPRASRRPTFLTWWRGGVIPSFLVARLRPCLSRAGRPGLVHPLGSLLRQRNACLADGMFV